VSIRDSEEARCGGPGLSADPRFRGPTRLGYPPHFSAEPPFLGQRTSDFRPGPGERGRGGGFGTLGEGKTVRTRQTVSSPGESFFHPRSLAETKARKKWFFFRTGLLKGGPKPGTTALVTPQQGARSCLLRDDFSGGQGFRQPYIRDSRSGGVSTTSHVWLGNQHFRGVRTLIPVRGGACGGTGLGWRMGGGPLDNPTGGATPPGRPRAGGRGKRKNRVPLGGIKWNVRGPRGGGG